MNARQLPLENMHASAQALLTVRAPEAQGREAPWPREAPRAALRSDVRCFRLPKDCADYAKAADLILQNKAQLRYEERKFLEDGTLCVVLFLLVDAGTPRSRLE